MRSYSNKIDTSAGINFRGYDDGGECAGRALIKIGLKSK